MAEKPPLSDLELDDLFAAKRRTAPAPAPALMARVLADAAHVAAAQTAAPRATAAPEGLMQRILGAIGGWPGAAGLVTASVAGLAIGLATPEAIETLTSDYLGAANAFELDDFMPSYGGLFEEG
ncbi:dihydroorotate dehydrogenase [Candidatus Rhodobacter oscarellae]|nr:dihydroorotate dehydrogenase [Candidatus Rhodobacter lobularis]